MLIAFKSFSSNSVFAISTFTYLLISGNLTSDALRTQHVKVLQHEHVEIANSYDKMSSFPGLKEYEGAA